MNCCSCTLGWIIAVFVGLLIILKIYLKLSLRRNGSYTCLVGKTAIITGANTGIGYYTALDFAKRGARVILACRNENKAEDARRRIIKESKNPNVIFKLIDNSSLKSVRDFAKDINENEERIDILVNNAGAAGLSNHITNDGLETIAQVNHISGYLLTHLLLDKIKKSAPSRIINVSSITAKYAHLNPDKLNESPVDAVPAWADVRPYATSKLCNILFTTELAERLRGTGVTANTLNPGFVNTDIYRGVPGLLNTLLYAGANLFFKTSEEGAQTTIYLATSDEVENVTGKLFDNCRQITLYASAQNQDLAKTVWTKTEELAKLSESEKIK